MSSLHYFTLSLATLVLALSDIRRVTVASAAVLLPGHLHSQVCCGLPNGGRLSGLRAHIRCAQLPCLDSQAQLRPLGVDVLLGLFRRGKGATQRTFCTWGSSQYTPSPPAVDQARPPVLLSAERYADLSQRNRDHNIIKSHSQQSIEISQNSACWSE